MKKALFYIMAAALLLLAGCEREPELGGFSDEGDMISLVGSVERTDAITKSSLGEGNIVKWENRDSISVFTSNEENAKFITALEAPAESATFKGNIAGIPQIAFYPYSADLTLADGAITFQQPQVQQYAPESFATGTNKAVGVITDDGFTAKNIFGILKLKLAGTATVSSIKLSSLGEDHLWGTFSIDPSNVETSLTKVGDDGSETILLDCGDGVKLSSTPTTFLFVMPAGTLSEGFEATVNAADGSVAYLNTSREIEVSRSMITPMAQCDVITHFKSITFTPADQNFIIDNTGTDEEGD